jgi:acyl carrier protein
VLIRQTSLPITSSGKVQRNLCREQYLDGKLKVVHSWTNPAMQAASAKAALPERVQLHGEGVSWSRNGGRREPGVVPARSDNAAAQLDVPFGSRRLRAGSASIDQDRAAEQIEAWLLEWLVARLSLDPADVSRDRPFAEFGVDSLTAVELSHELEEHFKVPLPPIVAWNYPTPAALARYLAEQTTGIADSSQPMADELIVGAEAASADELQLAALLDEVENLSEDEAARQLAEQQRQA